MLNLYYWNNGGKVAHHTFSVAGCWTTHWWAESVFKPIHSTMLVSRCKSCKHAYLSQPVAYFQERNWCIYWPCTQCFATTAVTCTYVNDNDLPKIISPLLVTIAALCFVLFVSQKFTLDFCAHTELRMQYNTTCSSGNSCNVWVLTCHFSGVQHFQIACKNIFTFKTAVHYSPHIIVSAGFR